MWLTKFLWLGTPKDHSSLAATVLKKHFEGVPKSDLLTASRKFPPTARADLQRALEESFTKFGARPAGSTPTVLPFWNNVRGSSRDRSQCGLHRSPAA